MAWQTLDLIALPFVAGVKSLPCTPRFLIEIDEEMGGGSKILQAPDAYGEGRIALEQLNATRLRPWIWGQGMGLLSWMQDFKASTTCRFEILRQDERFVVNKGANIAFGGRGLRAQSTWSIRSWNHGVYMDGLIDWYGASGHLFSLRNR